MAEHYLDDSVVHAFWDNSLEPRLEIDPADVVIFECREASDNQITPTSSHDDLDRLKVEPIHPLTGPVYIKGAEPGDTLLVEILDFKHKGWGWNGISPGFGLLADDFQQAYLHHWRLDGDICHFNERSDIDVPFEPFCGVMGVAPKESGRIDTAPPRDNAGNVDLRGLVAGAKVWLPVLAPGALFSTGDCHAAQGDGEVCGTGIESPMTVTLRFEVQKNAAPPGLQFMTPSPLTRTDTAGYFATSAHGPDLFANAQNAIRFMIDYITRTHGLSREEAFVLCSAAVDLKISEIVNAPNWLVSAYLPLSIFKG